MRTTVREYELLGTYTRPDSVAPHPESSPLTVQAVHLPENPSKPKGRIRLEIQTAFDKNPYLLLKTTEVNEYFRLFNGTENSHTLTGGYYADSGGFDDNHVAVAGFSSHKSPLSEDIGVRITYPINTQGIVLEFTPKQVRDLITVLKQATVGTINHEHLGMDPSRVAPDGSRTPLNQQ